MSDQVERRPKQPTKILTTQFVPEYQQKLRVYNQETDGLWPNKKLQSLAQFLDLCQLSGLEITD